MDGADRCECFHDRSDHGRKRCMGTDSYGIRCECDGFVLDRSCDDDEPDDPNDFIQRRSVARQEEVLHAEDCADYYAEQA